MPFHKGQRVKLRPVEFHVGARPVLVDNCEFGTVEDPGTIWTWVQLDTGRLWRFHAENIIPMETWLS